MKSLKMNEAIKEVDLCQAHTDMGPSSPLMFECLEHLFFNVI